ncbi:MAG: hypothetical protein ABFD65_05035 [Candidatus Polarisedimenticolia bacterium]|nr:hypothetical protein [bacterium]
MKRPEQISRNRELLEYVEYWQRKFYEAKEVIGRQSRAGIVMLGRLGGEVVLSGESLDATRGMALRFTPVDGGVRLSIVSTSAKPADAEAK